MTIVMHRGKLEQAVHKRYADGARIALQSAAGLDTTDESVPVGGFQVAGGVAYVRTA